MRVIGLTGGIACGKSTVSSVLAELGATVVDADGISRSLTQPGGAALPALREAFGAGIFRADGTLNRQALSGLVFSSGADRERLNALLWPMIERRMRACVEEARARGTAVCVLDVPLLYEAGMDSMCDTVWCVWLPEQVQLARLQARDGSGREEALARIRSQMPLNEKARRASFVLDNSGTLADMRALVQAQYTRELLQAAPRRRPLAAESTAPAPAARRRTVEAPPQAMDRPVLPGPAGKAGAPSAGAVGTGAAARSTAARSTAVRSAEVGKQAAEQKAGQEPAASARWPRWLVTVLCSLFLVLCATVTAEMLMRAWLTRQEQAREAAAQRVLEAHPLDSRYRSLIEETAAEYNLQPAYVAAIILNESSFNPRAVSSKNARGLMQLMEKTAAWVAGKLRVQPYSFEMMFEPETNIRFGCWYLNYLSGLYRGDPVLVTCAYHAGQGSVTSWQSTVSGDGFHIDLDSIPMPDTQTYVRRVTRDYGIYQSLYYPETDGAAGGADDALRGS